MAAVGALDRAWNAFPLVGPQRGTVWARKRARRNWRPWAIGAVVVAAIVLFSLFQFTPLFQSGSMVVYDPVNIARVELEGDPQGLAISVVLSDNLGRDAALNGDMVFDVRQGAGAVWHQTVTTVAGDFKPLPQDSVLAGRLGYRVVVALSAFPIPPQRGNQATVTLTVTPRDGTPFSAVFRDFVP